MVKAGINGPLNLRSLGEAVAINMGISHKAGRDAVRAVLSTIVQAINAGHSVAITNFGTFQPVMREERKARNPQNGARVVIPAHKDVKFRISPQLWEIAQGVRPATITKKQPVGQ